MMFEITFDSIIWSEGKYGPIRYFGQRPYSPKISPVKTAFLVSLKSVDIYLNQTFFETEGVFFSAKNTSQQIMGNDV